MKRPVSITLDELHRRIAEAAKERIREGRSSAIRFVLRYWYEREVGSIVELEQEIEEEGDRLRPVSLSYPPPLSRYHSKNEMTIAKKQEIKEGEK